MKNKIIISESQYSRLFLNGQQLTVPKSNKEYDTYGEYNIVNENFILTEQTLPQYFNNFAGWLDRNVGRHISNYWDKETVPGAKKAYNVIRREFESNSITDQSVEGFTKLTTILNPEKAIPEIYAGFAEAIGPLKKKKSYEDIMDGTVELVQHIKNEIAIPLKNFIVTCSQDIHCLIDVASVAVLAIPGIGIALSAAIDIGHSGWYVYEYKNATTSEEKQAALIAGTLTLFGGIFGGGLAMSNRLVKEAAANPNIYKHASELIDIARSKKKFDASTLVDLNKKYKLTAKEVETSTKIIDQIKQIDPSLVNRYAEGLKAINESLNMVQRAELKKILKDNVTFETIMKNSNKDIVVSLKKYMNTKAGKEAMIEGGLFATLMGVLEIPAVQEVVNDVATWAKYKGRDDIRAKVEKKKYNWDMTKNLFQSDGLVDDNTKLENAWNKGWRPYPEYTNIPEDISREKYGEITKDATMWLLKPENKKYRTEGHIDVYGDGKRYKNMDGGETTKYKLKGDDDVEEENVRYIDLEKDVVTMNKPYKSLGSYDDMWEEL
jgi:hypothetical protein